MEGVWIDIRASSLFNRHLPYKRSVYRSIKMRMEAESKYILIRLPGNLRPRHKAQIGVTR